MWCCTCPVGLICPFVRPRYVEERFPQLLMHCAKITGALLSDERIFKEYLVPFRRPLPPLTEESRNRDPVPLANKDAPPDVNGGADDGRKGATLATPLSPVVSPAQAPRKLSLSPKPRAEPSPGTPPPLPSPGLDEGSPGVAGEAARGSGAAGDVPRGSMSNGGDEGTPPRPNAAGPTSQLRGGVAREDDAASAQASAREAAVAVTPPAPAPGRAAPSGGGLPMRVSEQKGPRGEGALAGVLLWNESAMVKGMGCR